MNKPRNLGHWLRRFLVDHLITERQVSTNTQKSYRDTFKLLLPFVSSTAHRPQSRLQVDDLTAQRVRQFLVHLEDERGCSAATRNQRLTAIRTLVGFVASREPAYLDLSAQLGEIAQKKSRSKPIDWLNEEQIKALLKSPDLNTRLGRGEHALLQFLYNTGARVSEAVVLTVSDLDFNAGVNRVALVTLHGKGGKTRQCPLWSQTADRLAVRVKNRPADARVFVNCNDRPYTRSGISQLVKRCAARVSSLKGRTVTPHVLRHTCACHLLLAGNDINTVRAWLGHVSLDTTNIYAQIDLRMKTKAVQLCEPTEVEPQRPWQEGELMDFLKSL